MTLFYRTVIKMHSKSKVLETIFYNIKDGDCLGFLSKGWKKYPISVATEGECTHVCTVWGIERSETSVSFLISEQSFHGGRLREVEIKTRKIGNQDVFYTNDEYINNQERIYYSKLIKPLTEEQLNIGIDDAENQDGKKYGYLTLLLGIEFLEKILPKFLKNKFLEARGRLTRVCSSHVAIQYIKMGLLNKSDVVNFKDFFYTPIEVLKFPFLFLTSGE